MKMSGAEFRAFLGCRDASIWPEGLYVEEEALRINGEVSNMDAAYTDTDEIEIVGGSTAWESLDHRDRPTPSLRALARRWAKLQTETRLLVTVPNDQINNLVTMARSIGATVHR